MLEEKTMVADALTGINGELMRFGEMIPQTDNKELKTTLKQLRPPASSLRKSCIRSRGKNPITCPHSRALRRSESRKEPVFR